MKKLLMVLVVNLVLFVSGSTGFAQEVTQEKLPELASAFTMQLAEGRSQEAVLKFDETMLKAMEGDELAEEWNKLTVSYGAFKDTAGFIETEIAGYHVVETALLFEKRIIVQRLAFDKEGRIAGLFFR
ncbi:MAG TPA: DUF3887 domain-containing protein [Candidatus Avacidaminococcus intestinavium]|uniref:DUF3887 domain-containing protein n=1 Tax=Candidatus Avacidaminococcus intestinavium TaxID=2840684 RepID=A0A9D1MNP1_9FIRM|nr:DUF3887 domain-containing protein [Candidatus Avacidaminococcus intestinavium]